MSAGCFTSLCSRKELILMRKLPLLALVILLHLAVAQVAPPKHESGAEHVKRSRAQNYTQRFEAASCAIVEIVRGVENVGASYGTGFYISPNGDIATASHVVGDRIWTAKSDG